MPTLLVIRYRNLTQAGVSFEGYLLAQLTKETKIRWSLGLAGSRVSNVAIRPLSLSFHPPAHFSLLTVLKQTFPHDHMDTSSSGFSLNSTVAPVGKELLSLNSFSKCSRTGSPEP